jgi:CNP1-like family protein
LTRARVLCALALLAAATGCSQPRPLSDDFDSKPWETQKALLPSYPKDGNLIRFYVGPALPFAFFVDPASVGFGQDGVVRFTLIARSTSAATNVSYEGIRCATYERKVYAYGRSDGSWTQARNSQWIPMTRVQANQHAALADDFFCTAERGVRAPEEVSRTLARGNQPR